MILYTLFGDRHYEIICECPLCGATREDFINTNPCGLCGHGLTLSIREIKPVKLIVAGWGGGDRCL